MKISEKKIRKLIRDEIDERKLRKNISSHISEVLGSKAVAKGRRSGSSSRGWRSSRDEPEQEEGGPAEGEIGTIIGSKDTKSLAPDAQPVFNEFISKANAAGYNIKITSARRVPSHQWQLKYVTPSALTPAKPCRSDHQYGYALDINASYTDDNGKKKRLFSKSSDREWKPLVDIANSVGLRWQGSADRVHFSLGSISNDTKAKCTKFYTDNIGSIGSGGKGTQAMKDLEQGPKNAAIKDILKIPDMAMFAESKASMVIKKVAESSQMERIAESVVRDAILRVIMEERLSEVLKSDAVSSGKRGSGSEGGEAGHRESSDDLEKEGPHEPFEMDAEIHPSSWDSSVAKLWNKLDDQAKKFIMAMPRAIASLGFAKDEAEAKKKASMIIGGTYRSNAGQAAAVYGGPYLNDLQGRATGCKPGAYYFVRGDTCAAKPGGVYATSGKYADIFKKYEEITGFGSSDTLPDDWQKIWQSKKSAAGAAGAAILGPDTGEGSGHGSGKAIDSVPAGGGIAGQSAMIDKAASISNTNAHKYKEVDHIHITVTEERRLHDLIRNILSEDMNEVLGSSASANKGGRAGGGRAGGGRYRGSSRSDSSDDLIKGERKDAKTMSISAAGLQRIKKEEGYRDQVYDDDPSQDIISSYEQAVGYPTIGVGHLVYKAGSKDERAKYEKYLGGKEKMTPAQVDELLATDIDNHTKWKNDITEPITQNMFDALADFAFNAGNSAPKQDGILAAINKGDFKGAAAILKTARGGGAGGSHASRRREEAELFLA